MKNTRRYWLEVMTKIASPVLEHLAQATLKSHLPTDLNPPRAPFAPLEAFGRTLCGIAPWLELEGLTGEELALQRRYRTLARECIDKATDPASPDAMIFSHGGQPLVDAAFLAHALVRAPRQLIDALDDRVKANLAAALKSSRAIVPGQNNWLFFAAMVEAALCLMSEQADLSRVTPALDRFESEWYVGDGHYSDGPRFHWDYYNSFVIQPMFLDVARTFAPRDERCALLLPVVQKRATRYAHVLEKLIAPDGSYPVIGRSVAYRFGAFQLLSQAALQGILPRKISDAQVRCALTAVMQRCLQNDATFDQNGWLLPGVCGYQPELAEGYINRGSLYLCCAVFLPLGLAPEHAFWQDADADWTSKRIWSGQRTAIDHALD